MTHASVFSGIGGPEVAASMLGWENLFHCEINPFGRAVLDYWYPNAKSYEDITKTDFTEWRGRVDVLTGGFPCQPFSYAGKRGGASDDRYLWPYMFRCIDQVQPRWVVAKNVAGILTMVEQGEVSQVASAPTLFDTPDSLRGQYQLRETFTLQRICDDLEGHGYEVQPVLIPACGVGAPHRRDRVFIVGHRKDDSRHYEYGDVADTRNTGLAKERPEQPTAGTAGEGSQHVEGWTSPEPSCSGARAPRQGGGTEGSGSDRHLQQSQRQSATEWSDRFYAILRHAADTDNVRLHGRHSGTEERHGQTASGFAQTPNGGSNASESIGRSPKDRNKIRDAADTDNLGLRRRCSEDRNEWPDGQEIVGRELLSELEGCDGYARCGDRWRDFPSVSPVHRGNDGLPFPLDDLTLSPGKWRTEALKAYGNAIVPQVMYEIFRAIEQVEQQQAI